MRFVHTSKFFMDDRPCAFDQLLYCINVVVLSNSWKEGLIQPSTSYTVITKEKIDYLG